MTEITARIEDAMRSVSVTDVVVVETPGLLVAAFPTTGCDSIRSLCELTERVAVAMHRADIVCRRIRVTGLGGAIEIAV